MWWRARGDRPLTNVTLAELCSLIIDSEHKTAPKTPDGAHPLIRTTDLGRARADLSDAQRVDSKTYALWTKRAKPTTNDLILAREAPVGGVYRVPQGVKPALGQRTVLLRPDPNVVNSRFLMYRLAADDLQARMAEMSTGSTVPHLNMADIRQFPLPPLPSLADQRRIAGVLGTLDDLIEINERRMELLEDLARSLYREWFVQFRFPGYTPGVDGRNKAGFVPDGWTLSNLGDIASVNPVTLKSSDLPDLFHYLDIGTLKVGRMGTPSILKVVNAPGRARRQVQDGDVVWGMVRPNRRAHALVHDPPTDLIASTGLAVLRPETVPSSFLFECAATRSFSDYLVGRATGSAYPAVNAKDFRSMPVVVPPRELLEQFDVTAGRLLRLKSVLDGQNRQFAVVRDLLLPGLVAGKLDTCDLDLGVLDVVSAE
jgi:type I restriction enzyme, S subunit